MASIKRRLGSILGPEGRVPQLVEGTTTQLSPGEPARVIFTKTGDAEYRVDAQVPRGLDGDPTAVANFGQAMAAEIHDEGSTGGTALTAAMIKTIDGEVSPVYATKAQVSTELDTLAAPVVADIISNDPTVSQNAAALAQSDVGLLRGDLKISKLDVTAPVTVQPVVPQTVPADVPPTTTVTSPAAVPTLNDDGVVDDSALPNHVVRTVGGKIPGSVIPGMPDEEGLWEAIDLTLPPPPMLSADSFSATVGERMPVPTPDGSGQSVHPYVLHFPQGVFGYKWWMAVTGYTNRTTATEDPLILASHTGLPGDWVVPEGVPFPLDDAGNPGQGEGYNSDASLLYDPVEGRMYVFWRRFRSTGDPFYVTLMVRSTTDGKTFTEAEVVAEFDDWDVTAPDYVLVDGEWMMFTVHSSNLGVLELRKAPAVTGPWSEPTTTDLTLPGSLRLWHCEVRKVGQWWLALAQDRTEQGNGGGELRVAVSLDPVTGWEVASESIVPRLTIEHEWLYKGTILPYASKGQWKWRLYYSGFSGSQSWLFYSEIERSK